MGPDFGVLALLALAAVGAVVWNKMAALERRLDAQRHVLQECVTALAHHDTRPQPRVDGGVLLGEPGVMAPDAEVDEDWTTYARTLAAPQAWYPWGQD